MLRFFACCAVAGSLLAQSPIKRPLGLTAPVEDKNFYVLARMERIPEARKALHDSEGFSKITAARVARLQNAAKTCKTDVQCYGSAIKWNAVEIEEARAEIVKLYQDSVGLRLLARS